MKARWHSRFCVTIVYRRAGAPWLVRRCEEIVCAATLVLVGSGLTRLLCAYLALRASAGIRGAAERRVAAAAPQSWWSSASWTSEIPQPASLIAPALAEHILLVWSGALLAGGWALLTHCFVPDIEEEQLTVSRGLGVQIRWLGPRQKVKFVKFVPADAIREVAVTEAFQNSRVVTILAIVPHAPIRHTIVPFRHTLPHQEDLYVIQDAIHELLKI